MTFSRGIHGLGSTDKGNPPASRAAGRVDFDKIEATVSRTQPLFDRFSAYVSGYGQYAFTPLLVPEQCGFGGGAVRWCQCRGFGDRLSTTA